MDRICQHCGELIVGDAYRVTSQEQGIPCSILSFAPSVLWKPSDFGSIQRKSILEASKSQLETE